MYLVNIFAWPKERWGFNIQTLHVYIYGARDVAVKEVVIHDGPAAGGGIEYRVER